MSDDFNPLYNYLPLSEDTPELNEALRQIDDSLRFLLEELRMSRANPPYIPAQQYRQNGINDDVDSGSVPEDVWNGPVATLVWPTAAAPARVVSSSALDADPGGTGVRSVRLFGVDANNDYITEDINLNGVTPVLSSASFLFVHFACGINRGSTLTNQGDVDIDIDRTNVICRISAQKGQSQSSHFIVPNPILPGKAPYIESFQFQALRNSGYVVGELVSENPGEVIRAGTAFGGVPEGPIQINEINPRLPLLPGQKIWVRVTETGGSSNNWLIRSAMSIGYYDAISSDGVPGTTGVRSLQQGF